MQLLPRLALALASLLPLVATGAVVTDPMPGTTPGTAGVVLVDLDAGMPIADDIRFSPDVATLTIDGAVLGRAQSAQGINRVEIAMPADTAASPRLATVGISIWADTFTFQGDAPGVAQISVAIHGSRGTGGVSAARYLLLGGPFAATAIPMLDAGDALEAMIVLFRPGASIDGTIASALSLPEDGPDFVNGVLTGEIAYTPGVPVSVVSVLVGVVTPGGSFSAFDTATFAMAPPVGTTYVSASGVAYPAAVPEPGTWLLTIAGLALVAGIARRR